MLMTGVVDVFGAAVDVFVALATARYRLSALYTAQVELDPAKSG
jgi:hypothetical protein